MARSLSRRLRALAAVVLSCVIFSSMAAAAAVRVGRATGPAPIAPTVQLSPLALPVGAALQLNVSPLTGALTPLITGTPALGAVLIPAVIPTAMIAAPRGVAANLSAISQAIAPHLQSLTASQTQGELATLAGVSIESALTGAISHAPQASLSGPIEGTYSKGYSLSKPAVEEDRSSYQAKRARLAAIAKEHGISSSLPVAGPKLTQAILDEASRRKVVFSDFDDTIGAFNSVLTPDVVDSIVAMHKAGKTFVLVTDRTDVRRAGSTMLSAFESLATIPAEQRAGMYVAANSGGKVYKYDEKGEPQKVWEFPPLAAEVKATVAQAVEATKEQFAAAGVVQHPGDAVSPSESAGPYGHSIMLAVGTPEAKVKEVAQIYSHELASRGIEVEVLARVAKDPKNPPYITFSVVNKAVPVAWISKALGVSAKDAVAVGDNLYMPRIKDGPLSPADLKAKEEAERLSGHPMPLTGNETDRNMEKGLPGLMALSVGGTADAAMADAWVLDGKGVEMSKKLFYAMADPKPLPAPAKAAPAKGKGGRKKKVAPTPEQIDADLKSQAESIPGAESVSVQAGRVSIAFSDRASMAAAPAQLKDLDNRPRYVTKSLSAAAVAAENAGVEEAHRGRLAAFPGVLSVSFHHEGYWPSVELVLGSLEQMKALDQAVGYEFRHGARRYTISTRLSSEGKPVADSAIESAARSVASYKGRPWSSTEYNMNYSLTLDSLRKQGATEEQLQRFRDLADAAPVKAGGFNPWSGD